MSKQLTSAAEVFDKLGGISAVAELTGTTYRAAFNWKASNSFPPKTYVAVKRALADAGCDAPASLWGMVEVEAAE